MSTQKLPHKRLAALVVALCLLAGAVAYEDAYGQTQPVPGIYWNQAEPGRGFPFDFQNGVGAITGYIYDSDGQPLWFLAAGPMTDDNTRLRATADVYEDGQCLGCPPTRPDVIGNLGVVDLKFTAPDVATLRIDDVVIQIERQNFGFQPAPRGMLGAWHFISTPNRAESTGVTYVFEAVSPEPSGIPGGTGVFVDTVRFAAGECFVSGDLAGACLVAEFTQSGDVIRAYLYVQRTDRLYGARLDPITFEPDANMQGLHLLTFAPSVRSKSSGAASSAGLAALLGDAATFVDPGARR